MISFLSDLMLLVNAMSLGLKFWVELGLVAIENDIMTISTAPRHPGLSGHLTTPNLNLYPSFLPAPWTSLNFDSS